MTKDLIIIGARGFGREVYALALTTHAYAAGEYRVKGFLDSDATLFDGFANRGGYPPILGSVEGYNPQENDVFVVAMGDPSWRRHYAEIIARKGGSFVSIISPLAFINPTATVGAGSVVSGWTVVSDHVTLGQHTLIQAFATLGHDASLGDYGTLEPYVFLGGNTQVGEGSILRVRSTVLRLKKVGKNCSVGAHSVVMRNVPDGQHVFGAPAKVVDF